jgi:hypothetical protein
VSRTEYRPDPPQQPDRAGRQNDRRRPRRTCADRHVGGRHRQVIGSTVERAASAARPPSVCLDDGVAEDVRWQDERMEESGTVELDFVVERPTGVVPCAAWLPISPPPWPLVLVGHGGSGHKRSDRNVGLGRWFSSHAQIAVLAIDGPYHGDRVTAPLPAAVYQRRMLDEGLQAVTDRMTADWKDAIAALDSHGSVDTTRLGYFGLSMGTRLGIPLVASLGGDLR